MKNHDDAVVMAQSLYKFLKDGEGIVVHLHGTGYCVARVYSQEDGQSTVAVYENNDYLEYEDLSLVIVHDGPIGHA